MDHSSLVHDCPYTTLQADQNLSMERATSLLSYNMQEASSRFIMILSSNFQFIPNNLLSYIKRSTFLTPHLPFSLQANY